MDKWDKLFYLNILAAILHLTSSIVFILLKKKSYTVKTHIDFIKWSCNTDDDCIVEASKVEGITIDGIWLIISFSLISSFFHFLAVFFFKFYKSNISNNVNVLRWIEYSVSAPIMIVVISLVNGVTSLQTIVLIFFTTSTVMLIGYIQELFDSSRYPTLTRITPHLLGWIPYVAVWFVIFLTFTTSVLNSPSKPPEFVYGIVFTLFFLFTTFGINQLLHNVFGIIRSYETSEVIYVILSLVSKLSLSWMLFNGMLRQ